LVRTVGDGVELGLRALALPGFLALRWWSQQGRIPDAALPRPRASLGLAMKVALDEFFFATEVVTLRLIASQERHRIGHEVRSALRLYAKRGWLARPALYHRTPPAIERTRFQASSASGVAFEQLSFESGYEPHPGEPGRRRWLSYDANRTAHAWVVRHPGPERPWVVCIPGFRMGNPTVDFTGFRVSWLHEVLGLNVAVPVLPFHGPRRVGRRGGDGYLSGDFLDTVHAQAQAVWDARRVIRWLRREGAPSIAAYGVSLGGYTTGLLAALEPELDCVVAGIPAACFLGLARWNAPPLLLRAAERFGFEWERVEELLTVVSPLAFAPRVPQDRLYLYAGVADRLAPPHQALELWRHWGEPRLEWYHGSHVSFVFEPGVETLLREAFRETGVLGRRPRVRAA
jgi:dienelactone hydrolase